MKLVRQHEREVGEFLRVCRRLGERMYVTSHGGNLSLKLQEDLYLITPTRICKSELTAADLVFIDHQGAVIEGRREPTGETPMYLRFFCDRPDVRSVIHCHPPFTNAFAILKNGDWLMRPVFPETVIEVGPVPIVPYGEPLTAELAEGFAPFLSKYNAFLMENHGLVLISPEGITRTMQLIEILEMTAVTLLQALAAGEIKELSKEALRGLENTRRKRKLPMIGAPGINDSIEQVYAGLRPIQQAGTA
jgi:L-fuculose-phosphate aldolase